MKQYRAYLIDRDGHIKHRVDLVCEAEEAARARAKLIVDRHVARHREDCHLPPSRQLSHKVSADARLWAKLYGWLI